MNRLRASVANITPWYRAEGYALNRVMPTFIHDYTNQRYWNTTDGETAFPIATLRTTNATMIDRQGRLSWAPHQLCSRGQTLSSWSIGSDGTISLSGNYAPTGAPSYYAQWTTSSPTAGVQLGGQAVVVGAYMSASIYLRYVNHEWARLVFYSSFNTSSQNRCWVNLRTKTLGTVSSGVPASNTTASIQDVGNGWVRVTVTGLNQWNSTTDGNVLFATTTGDGSTTRVGDGATIEAASCIFEMTGAQTPQDWRPEFNTSGSAVYLPRFEYNHVTGEARGLRIEPSQTNLVPTSSGTGAAMFNGVGSSVSDGAPTWSFGTAVITGGTSGTQQYVTNNGTGLSATTGSSYSVSLFIKRGTSRYAQLTTSANYNTPATTAPYINYDFDTGSFTTGGTNYIASSGFAIPIADGWVRVGFSFTANATSTGASVILAIVDSNSALRLDTATSTGLTVLAFGGQVENQGQVTSFIPTYGTTATRAADNFTLTSIPWYNQTEGSIYARAVPSQSDTVNTRRLLEFSDGTSNNRYQMARASSAARVQNVSTVGGVSSFVPISTTSTTDYVSFKSLMTYTTALRRITLNGDTVTSSATVGPSSGMTQLIVGSLVGLTNANTFGGWVQEIRYYGDGSASDAQIQAMTV